MTPSITGITGITSANAARPAEEVGRSASLSQQEKIAELSRQFEGMLLRQMLKEARKPMLGDTLTGTSSASKIYDDMVTERLADSIARTGDFGLATSLQAQLLRQRSEGEATGANPAAAKLEGNSRP